MIMSATKSLPVSLFITEDLVLEHMAQNRPVRLGYTRVFSVPRRIGRASETRESAGNGIESVGWRRWFSGSS